MTVFTISARNSAKVLFVCLLVVAIAVVPVGFAAGSQVKRQSSPCLTPGAELSQHQKQQVAGGGTPVLFVHGLGSSRLMWTGGGSSAYPIPKIQGTDSTLFQQVEHIGSTVPVTFDYSAVNTKWVTDPSIGGNLAKTIRCLAQMSHRKVVIVGHSMGGLAAQWASAPSGGGVSAEVSDVITLGTPERGSWLAGCGVRPSDRSNKCRLARVLFAVCKGGNHVNRFKNIDPSRAWGLVPNSPFCRSLPRPGTPAADALGKKNSLMDQLPSWPAPSQNSPKVHRLAGVVFASGIRGINADAVGDLAVSRDSATDGDAGATVDNCRGIVPETCEHPNLHQNPKLANVVMGIVKGVVRSQAPATHPMQRIDWNNRSYRLACDDIVKNPVPVVIHRGNATVRGADLGGYDNWAVHIQQTAHGSLPGLGNVTAILFGCTPQPSNFFRQEVRVYRSTDGTEIGRVPTINAPGRLPPQYQQGSLAIRNNGLGANLKFYGPNDTHASGPSDLRHLTWMWNGRQFVMKKPSTTHPTSSRVDLSRQRVTVNGIGPLHVGMSRTEAEKAIAASIPNVGGGPTCSDLAVTGGPKGLSLRFANNRLVAVTVNSPAVSISTASGIHIGSARADVMHTYAGQISDGPSAGGTTELVFAPTGKQFTGKIITFALTNGTVKSIIAGERKWAELLPCAD